MSRPWMLLRCARLRAPLLPLAPIALRDEFPGLFVRRRQDLVPMRHEIVADCLLRRRLVPVPALVWAHFLGSPEGCPLEHRPGAFLGGQGFVSAQGHQDAPVHSALHRQEPTDKTDGRYGGLAFGDRVGTTPFRAFNLYKTPSFVNVFRFTHCHSRGGGEPVRGGDSQYSCRSGRS